MDPAMATKIEEARKRKKLLVAEATAKSFERNERLVTSHASSEIQKKEYKRTIL
jgi:ABC-type uncharacterized transport system auxiliary subunit